MADTSSFGILKYKRFGPLNAQIRAVSEQFGEQTGQVLIGAMFYLGSAVKEDTPYRTGRATAHWKLALNGRPGPYDPMLTEARGMTIDIGPIEHWKPGDRIHLYNKAPYAVLLEEGWSKQAGPGQMLRHNVDRFPEFMERAAMEEDLL